MNDDTKVLIGFLILLLLSFLVSLGSMLLMVYLLYASAGMV